MQFINYVDRATRPAILSVLLALMVAGLLPVQSFGQEAAEPGKAKSEEEAKLLLKPVSIDPKSKVSPDVSGTAADEPASRQTAAEEKPTNTGGTWKQQNNWYVRPDRKKRFNDYVNSMVGPVSLARYAATAGMTTYRNSPSEWGDKWEGFGRRFASNLATGSIQKTVQYGLDEALKLDSKFYKSRKRTISARMRNAVFSAVTARDPKGKRVFGAPKLVGRVVSKVVAAEAWYPERYNYVHGLKGAAISTAISVGVNLFREFVFDR